MRYKLYIEYEGTRYSGWQRQPNAQTIEETLENAFTKILRERVNIIGQGRTDSGVHAEAQIAHVDIKQALDTVQFLYALLGELPCDIAVWKMEEVSSDFHARFDAKSRQYRYQIVTRPSPLWFSYALFEPMNLNIEIMKKCAQMLKGTHNFEKFSKSNKDQSTTNCNVFFSKFEQHDHLIIYRVKANRFVRHMVRRLMGTMLQVGKNELVIDDLQSFCITPAQIKQATA